MAQNKKRVWCDFYQCEIQSSRHNLPSITMEEVFARLLSQFEHEELHTVNEIAGRSYELKALEKRNFGFIGSVAKYKNSDLPSAGVPGGEEREIDLEENEQLLEKTYFSFYEDYSLLILERRRVAVGDQKFAEYLSFGGYTVALNPIIEAADLRRLMSSDVHVRVAELIIARPTNAVLFEGLEHDFNNAIISSLGSTNSAKVNMTLRGDGHSKNPEKRYLDSSIKRALLELKDRFDLEKAQIELEDDAGIAHPLDLVTDRLVYDELIQFDGRKPLKYQMFDVLENARREKNAEIENYFGTLAENRLD